MKTKVLFACFLLLFSALLLLLRGQSSSNATGSSAEKKGGNAPFSFACGVDPSTWKIIGPESESEWIDLLNSNDQLEQRRKSALMLLSPREYARLFPKSSRELDDETLAVTCLIAPRSLEEVMNDWTTEELAKHTVEMGMMHHHSEDASLPVLLPNPLIMSSKAP